MVSAPNSYVVQGSTVLSHWELGPQHNNVGGHIQSTAVYIQSNSGPLLFPHRVNDQVCHSKLCSLGHWRNFPLILFSKYVLLIRLLQFSHYFSPLYSPPPCTTHPTSIPHSSLSSCLWVIHTSSLASPCPILFLTSPCLFLTYYLSSYFLYLFLPSPPDW